MSIAAFVWKGAYWRARAGVNYDLDRTMGHDFTPVCCALFGDVFAVRAIDGAARLKPCEQAGAGQRWRCAIAASCVAGDPTALSSRSRQVQPGYRSCLVTLMAGPRRVETISLRISCTTETHEPGCPILLPKR